MKLDFKRSYAYLVTIILFLLILTACSEGEPYSGKVVFMAGYKAQANLPFVSAYVAQEKGFFQEQGLNVEILHASSGEHIKLLMSGDVDFTTSSATSVLKYRSDPGLPLVSFALFGQRSQQAFAALSKSGMSTPKDWKGKTFGYKVSIPPEYLAILKANKIDRSEITEIPVGFDPRILIEGKIDILAVFNSNEPDTILTLGFDVDVWTSADFGVPGMGLTYVTTQELVNNDPEKITRFLKATMKGLLYASENKEDALDIVMKYAPDQDRSHQLFMLETELEDAISESTAKNGLGWMMDNQWKTSYEQLLEFGALTKDFDYRKAYTNKFIELIYKPSGHETPSLQWP